jgi:hypothetical protein
MSITPSWLTISQLRRLPLDDSIEALIPFIHKIVRDKNRSILDKRNEILRIANKAERVSLCEFASWFDTPAGQTLGGNGNGRQ